MEHITIDVGCKETTIKYDIFKEEIIPEFIIEKGFPLHIKKLHKKFHLGGFMIERWNDKLRRVKVFGIHPNADGDTGELCFKKEEKNVVITNILSMAAVIINRLKVYYYDDCHFKLKKINCETEPVDAYTLIDVNFDKGKIHGTTPPFRRLYPKDN